MGSLSTFRAFGLNIASEYDIPGGIRVDAVMAEPDIVIRSGKNTIGAAETINGPYSRSGDSLLFDAPGVALYSAPTPQQLFIDPYPDSNPRTVGELLIATALPMMMWMRGGVVLHAAGLVLPGADCAIAIAGPSGIGKSTLALAMVETGARLVGDDSLWLTMSDGVSIVSGLSATLFKSVEPENDRTAIALASHSQVEYSRLAAIIILQNSEALVPITPRKLSGVEALEALLRNRHRPKIPAILKLDAALLPQCILHCRTLPIYEFTITSGDIAATQQQISSFIFSVFRGESE